MAKKSIANVNRFTRQSVTFNKEKINAEITRLTFCEARRVRGPIYEALIDELNEAGCITCAKYFKILVEKERKLINDETIREEVSNEPTLLRTMFENAKSAEIVFRTQTCLNSHLTYAKLFECLRLVKSYGTKFDWLRKEMYHIISKICTDVDPELPNEKGLKIIANIHLEHGQYLSEKNRDLPLSLKYLEKAIELARPNKWMLDDNNPESLTLHEVIAQELSQALMKYAQALAENDIKMAITFAEKAIVVIAEVLSDASKLIYATSHVLRAELFIKLGAFEKGLQNLEKIQGEIYSRTSLDYKALKCRYLCCKGICLQSLGSLDQARIILRQAKLLSEQMGLKFQQAEICLQLGKLYSQVAGEKKLARDAFTQAKRLFAELKKVRNEQCASYMLAKLHADELFPDYLNLFKGQQNEQICRFYSLRQWKNRCEFFKDAVRDDVSPDPIYCLLRPIPTNLPKIRQK